MKNWIDKIKITEGNYQKQALLSDNSFGIYINYNSKPITVISFKPLNDVFPANLNKSNKSLLIGFERELIEEDDIEYALDIMSLFNKKQQLFLQKKTQTNKIKKVIDLILEEFKHQDSSYIMIKTLLKVLMLDLIRFQNKKLITQDHNQKRVYQFLELMEIHFIKQPKTEFYALAMGISQKRLNQILKEKLNLTAKQIIQQRQLTEAKRKLVKSDITIKELSYILNFDSMSSFSRFFKKKVGITPSKYRGQYKQ